MQIYNVLKNIARLLCISIIIFCRNSGAKLSRDYTLVDAAALGADQINPLRLHAAAPSGYVYSLILEDEEEVFSCESNLIIENAVIFNKTTAFMLYHHNC